MREWHQLVGLIARISEHVSLVSGTNVVFFAINVHTLCDIGTLLLQRTHDIHSLVVEA